MMQIVLLLHRYLGMAVGVVMTLWCLSGFVMMYRGYPQVTELQRVAGLQPLDLAASRAPPTLDLAGLEGFRIEMLAGRLVLRIRQPDGERTLDLASGASVGPIAPPAALAVARTYALGAGLKGAPRSLALIDKDQWTIVGATRRGPVYRIGLDDPARTVLYVSRRTGEVAQATTGQTRLWGWLGAVPHWLYPTILRQNGRLWSTVVVWLALIGCFLTATGLYVGIVRFRRYAGGRWSPYRGWHYWHHIAGLLFGVLTLTWVASGLVSMNPWGFLDTSVGEAESSALQGPIDPASLQRFLAAAPRQAAPPAAVLEAAPLGGRLYVIERFADGRAVRLDAGGAPAPLARGEMARALARMGGPPVADLALLRREDAYYYKGYQRPAPLPVWRARLAGPGGRTWYLDPVSGEMVLALDATARTSRWLRTGLHDLDFPGLRERPLWDLVVLALLAGVTVSCATGTWLGLKRLVHDLRRLARRHS